MWVKLSDDFAEHPKVHQLGADVPLAIPVWFAGACYSAKYKLDGFIPQSAVSAVGLSPEQAATGAAALCRVRLWEPVEGGYQIHDYADHNITRSDYQQLREKRQSAGRAGAAARWADGGGA